MLKLTFFHSWNKVITQKNNNPWQNFHLSDTPASVRKEEYKNANIQGRKDRILVL